ncbi:glycine cleavage system protein R [Vibrio sp. RC27]
MMSTFIVSFIGEANPSDIQQLATITHENFGTWLVSKVNFLDSQVAAVIKIELPTEHKDAVIDAFISHPNLTAKVSECNQIIDNNDEHIYQLRMDARDRAGIVNDITHLLDSQRVRVLDLNCQRVFITGNSGISSTIFTANISVKLPKLLSIDDIIKELESLSEETKVMLENRQCK